MTTSETVNARTFGADPSRADNSDAIQEACDRARHVYLPGGNYRIRKGIRLGQTILRGPNAGAATLVADNSDGWFTDPANQLTIEGMDTAPMVTVGAPNEAAQWRGAAQWALRDIGLHGSNIPGICGVSANGWLGEMSELARVWIKAYDAGGILIPGPNSSAGTKYSNVLSINDCWAIRELESLKYDRNSIGILPPYGRGWSIRNTTIIGHKTGIYARAEGASMDTLHIEAADPSIVEGGGCTGIHLRDPKYVNSENSIAVTAVNFNSRNMADALLIQGERGTIDARALAQVIDGNKRTRLIHDVSAGRSTRYRTVGTYCRGWDEEKKEPIIVTTNPDLM